MGGGGVCSPSLRGAGTRRGGWVARVLGAAGHPPAKRGMTSSAVVSRAVGGRQPPCGLPCGRGGGRPDHPRPDHATTSESRGRIDRGVPFVRSAFARYYFRGQPPRHNVLHRQRYPHPLPALTCSSSPRSRVAPSTPPPLAVVVRPSRYAVERPLRPPGSDRGSHPLARYQPLAAGAPRRVPVAAVAVAVAAAEAARLSAPIGGGHAAVAAVAASPRTAMTGPGLHASRPPPVGLRRAWGGGERPRPARCTRRRRNAARGGQAGASGAGRTWRARLVTAGGRWRRRGRGGRRRRGSWGGPPSVTAAAGIPMRPRNGPPRRDAAAVVECGGPGTQSPAAPRRALRWPRRHCRRAAAADGLRVTDRYLRGLGGVVTAARTACPTQTVHKPRCQGGSHRPVVSVGRRSRAAPFRAGIYYCAGCATTLPPLRRPPLPPSPDPPRALVSCQP